MFLEKEGNAEDLVNSMMSIFLCSYSIDEYPIIFYYAGPRNLVQHYGFWSIGLMGKNKQTFQIKFKYLPNGQS